MDKYLLHARQKQLLYLLNCQHGLVTGSELAAKLNTSERTVRNDILQINEVLESQDVHIQAVRGKGYWLLVGNRAVLHELLSDGENKQTRQDRIRYLLERLVRSDEWCDLMDLEDEMYVSRSTLETDLKEIRLRISENQPCLPMLRNGNYIKLENNENKKRNILIHLYSENWDYDSREGIVLKDGIFCEDIFNHFRKVWKLILRQKRIELDDFGLIYLILASAVAYARFSQQNHLMIVDRPCRTPEITMAAEEFWNRVGAELGCQVPRLEYDGLAGILEQLVILNFDRVERPQIALPMDERCDKFAAQLLEEIRELYYVDFSKDERFCAELLLHIQALLNCMISVQHQNRYMEEALRIKYPFLGDIAGYLGRRLKALCGVHLKEFDENYLVPFLVTAWHRMEGKKKNRKISVAVVSHLNFGLTYYLMERLNGNLGPNVDLMGPFPIYDRSRIDEAGPMLIITTARMDAFRKYNIPVIHVSPLVEAEELENIRQGLDLVRSRLHTLPLPSGKSMETPADIILNIEKKTELSEVIKLVAETQKRSESQIAAEQPKAAQHGYCAESRNSAEQQNGGQYTAEYSVSQISSECLFLYDIGGVPSTVSAVVCCPAGIAWKQNRGIKCVVILRICADERRYLQAYYQYAHALFGGTEKM